MLTLERLFGLVAALLGALFLWVIVPMQTETLQQATTQPSLFPSVASAAMLFFGLWQVVRPVGTSNWNGREVFGWVVVSLVALAAVLSMEWIGYLPPSIVLVSGLAWRGGERRWPWLFGGCVVLPTLIWFLFDILLQRPLP